MNWIPLHVYSGYSFLQSGLTVKKIVLQAIKRSAKYASLCDVQSLSGAPELDRLARQYGLQPLIGSEFQVGQDTFCCFVQNETGYRNLLLLIAESTAGRLDLSFLSKHRDGLLLVMDGGASSIHSLFYHQEENLESHLRSLNHNIGNFYIGIPYLPGESDYLDFLHTFLSTHPYPRVAFPRIRYVKPEDAISARILEAISSSTTLEEKKCEGDEYFLSDSEAESYFDEAELSATLEIAEACSSFVLSQIRGTLLRYPVPKPDNADSYLRKLATEGLNQKLPHHDSSYDERLDYELNVISSMGYSDYFLLVWDYVAFAKKSGIPVGPGRGSSAGSLVSLCLDIVKADPIRYGLYFERFLNPERQSMPDIDVDFADTGREKVVAYLQQKYGPERVARIMTMQTMASRQSLHDIGRVFGYRDSEIRLLTSALDANPDHSLGWNYKNNATFRDLVNSDDYYKEIVSLASKIEGLPRQSGLHAAGIVLNNEPLQNVLPITVSSTYGFVEQYDKDYLQEQGFLKMDLLGLRNLTIVEQCLKMIQSSQGMSLKMEEIPYEEKEPLELLRNGQTAGLFQLETRGMTNAAMEIQPTCFEDVCALVALFRPGPMQNISSFARRKKGLEPIRYLTPELEPILSPTYGIILYQEQIMLIARKLAGLTFAESDRFRRAISHKDAHEFLDLQTKFLDGCVQKGLSSNIATQLFQLIERFADYGFNKSHSVSYALLACQMAYLKWHYPLEFYCSLLQEGVGSKDKETRLFHELKKRKISFSLPSINESTSCYEPKNGRILLPFSSISGLNSALIHGILDERMEKGPYQDFFDVATRLKKYGLDVSSLVTMVDAGCFDSFRHSREELRLTAPTALRYAEVLVGTDGKDNLLPFELPKPSYVEAPSSRSADLEGERRVLGRMISGSPLEEKKTIILKKGDKTLSDLEEAKNPIWVAGIVSEIKSITTKKGSKMAFLTVFDDSDVFEFTLFEEVYQRVHAQIQKGMPLLIKARRDSRKEDRFVAMEIENL